MPQYMSKINLKIDLGSPAYTVLGRSATDVKITGTENGFAVATISFHRPQGTLLTKLLKSSVIKAYVKDGNETAWTTLFNGKIRFLKKGLDNKGGSVITAKCDGSGYGFAEMLVGEEYGFQSQNLAVKTLKQIITDAAIGIVPNWVEKVLNGSVDSGYDYDTSDVDDITGDIPFLYFPYKPASKALGDLIDIMQALKGTNPGPHWLVNMDDKLLVTPVGVHSAAAIAAGWPTYVNNSVASATLIEARDFHDFLIDDQAEAANYILYNSKFQWPGNGDLTETCVIGDWDGTNVTLALATSGQKLGAKCLTATATAVDTAGIASYKSADFMHLNITRAGGMYTIPYFSFWAKRGVGTKTDDSLGVFFINDLPMVHYFWGAIPLAQFLPDVDIWRYIEMPIGPYWRTPDYSGVWEGWFDGTSPGDWSDINYIDFVNWAGGSIGSVWTLDGIRIMGRVLRGAYKSSLITSSQAKMRIVSDEYAKGDSLVATDDSGTIALLAKAELLRQMQTSRVATFTTKLIRAALPGQLVHVHARTAYDDAIDTDMRIIQLVHNITPALTNTSFTVTDDVTNSICRAAFDSVNEILKSYRPEFQDRQSTGTKLRDIDITQTILEKDYG